MTNDFLKKLIHKKVSPWDKGALIYHKSGMCGCCGSGKIKPALLPDKIKGDD